MLTAEAVQVSELAPGAWEKIRLILAEEPAAAAVACANLLKGVKERTRYS